VYRLPFEVCAQALGAESAGALGQDGAVSRAGLRTTAQPAASTGAAFTIASACGWFHGAIAPTTPTGSRRTRVLPEAKAGRRSSHSTLRASPA
jgi:hypothetical protein